MRNFFLVALTLVSCLLPQLSHAQARTFSAPEGQVSALMIFEQSSFARAYGVFNNAAARMIFDEKTKTLDNLKFALLSKTFIGSVPGLHREMQGKRGQNGEIDFVQSEPAEFTNNRAKIKGQLVANGVRKDITFDATLNKVGRFGSSADLDDDGATTIGLSLHTSLKRSEFYLSSGAKNSVFNDDAVLMLDILAR
jgi:polyisoprenoid-binding protein YceI